MLVVSRTQSGELPSDAESVGHKNNWLGYKSQVTAYASNPADHAELAQMCLDPLHIVMSEESLDHIQRPTGCQPRMLVDDKLAVLALVLTPRSAEPDVPFRLLHPNLEFLHPDVTAAMHELIKLLKTGAHRARW